MPEKVLVEKPRTSRSRADYFISNIFDNKNTPGHLLPWGMQLGEEPWTLIYPMLPVEKELQNSPTPESRAGYFS